MSLSDKISARVQAVPRSGIREFFELVLAAGDVISLGVGEPDFCSPWHIREAAIFSLEKGQTSYTSNLGLLELRKSIAKYVAAKFHVQYQPTTEVLVTVGVSEALDLAFRALLNPGEEVIYHEPCYVSYNPSIYMAYGTPVTVETKIEDDFALRASDVEKAITPKTKIIMLNFPTNPTGGVQPKAELEGIADLAKQHDLIVITDEIYSELLYDDREHHSIAALPGMKERTILMHGFSKAFAMTGFRLGYACSPPELTEAMMKVHQYSMLCAPITAQIAAVEALENGAGPVEKMRKAYWHRRNLVVSELNAAGLSCFQPGGAFYAFPEIRSTGLSSREFAQRLLEEEKVAVVPGTAFGTAGEGFVRCCYATDDQNLATAMGRIKAFAARHRVS
jgi:aminotransferase